MIQIFGPWQKGFAFDIHTLSSKRLEDDAYGNKRFDNKRSAIGQYLYELKYGQDFSAIEKIKSLLFDDAGFRELIAEVDAILPAPSSNKYRRIQPVPLISQEIARTFAKEIRSDVLSSTNTEEIKNIDSLEKYEKIKAAICVDGLLDKGKKLLIIDDVYDSGSTLIAITNALIGHGYSNINVFTLTKTRITD